MTAASRLLDDQRAAVARDRHHAVQVRTSRRPAPVAGRPARHVRGLVGALNAEWALLRASGADHTADVRRWAEADRAFEGLPGLGAVLAAVTRDGDDQVLNGLLVLAGDGDQLAARTALQAMLGAAVRLARRTVGHADGDLDEALSRAVCALWQVVRTYPAGRRRCRPADGIALDVLRALTTGGRRSHETAAGLPGELSERAHEGEDEPSRADFWFAAGLPGPACSDEQLLVLLAWAVRQNVISAADARLLWRVHSPADPALTATCREVAMELGLAHAAVRQRVSRATRRLAGAVQDVRSGASALPTSWAA